MEPKLRARTILACAEGMSADMAQLIGIRNAMNKTAKAVLLATPLDVVRSLPAEVRADIPRIIDDVMSRAEAVQLSKLWEPGRRLTDDIKPLLKRDLVDLALGRREVGAPSLRTAPAPVPVPEPATPPEPVAPAPPRPGGGGMRHKYARMLRDALDHVGVPAEHANVMKHKLEKLVIDPVLMTMSIDNAQKLAERGHVGSIEEALQSMVAPQLRKLLRRWDPKFPITKGTTEQAMQTHLRGLFPQPTPRGGAVHLKHSKMLADTLDIVGVPNENANWVMHRLEELVIDPVLLTMSLDNVRRMMEMGHDRAVDEALRSMVLSQMKTAMRKWDPHFKIPKDMVDRQVMLRLRGLTMGTVQPESMPSPRGKRKAAAPAPHAAEPVWQPVRNPRNKRGVAREVAIVDGEKRYRDVPARKADEPHQHYLRRLLVWWRDANVTHE